MNRTNLLLALILTTAATAFGQTGSSTLIGTLTDPADAVIPKGTITATAAATGAQSTAESNESGLFRVLDLKPGRYNVRVQALGFKALEIKDIELTSSETRNLGRLVMQIGAVTEEISVTAQATPVQTGSSERSAVIDTHQLDQVALKGRDAFGFMRLISGVVDTNPDRSLAGPGSASNLYINGMNTNTKNVTFDGVTQLDQGGANSVYVSPNMDAIGEMKVLTSAYQAEYGRTAGGGVNLVTKAGTQEFHGTAFWNRRHEDMNANDFFRNRQGIARPIYRYFIAGYSVGGPVYIPNKFNSDRRKLFFFVSQEFTRVAQPTVFSQATLPTDAERSGDFSNSVNSLGKLIPIIDPNTGAQFPGNLIPKNRIDPTGQAYLNLFLKPNGYVNPAPGQQYTANFLASATPFYRRRDDIVRVDYQVTNKMNMFVRWGNDTRDQEQEFSVSPGVGPLLNFLPGYNWSGHIVNMISSSMVNEIVIGVGHNNFGFYRQGGEKDSTYFRGSSLNPPTLRPFPTGEQYEAYLPAALFSGGALPSPGSFIPGYTGNFATNNTFPIPYKNFNDTYSFQDDVSKVLGAHNFKAGVYYEYNSKIEPSAGYQYAGVLNFGSNVNNPLDTGHGYANALLGNFQTYTEATNRLIPNPHFTELEGYVQDNWRVSRRLTLDLGLRWYHVGLMQDDSKAYSEFYPQLWDAKQAARIYRPATVGGKTVALDPATGNTTFAALQNTIVPGSGSAVNGMKINGLTGNSDFAQFPTLLLTPRIGLAWDVNGNGKTAVRVSFGTFYNRPNANFIQGRGAPPTIFIPVVYYSPINQIPQAAASAALSPTNGIAVYGEQKIERNHNFNLTIQRDIGFGTVLDVGYVGNFDRHAQTTRELNPIQQGAYANPANLFNNTEMNPNLLRTRFPGMGTITYYSNSLSSVNYHGLQVSAQHRMSRGLQFGISYVFSKVLGTCGSVAANGSGCTIADPFHGYREWYYGPLPWDRRNVMNINYSYNIPSPTTMKVLKEITGHWTLSGIAAFQTGAPVTPDCSSLNTGPQNSDPSLSGVGAWTAANPAGARCQAVGDPKNFAKSFYTNFNTSAFTVAPVGTFGNIGLGILRQPSWYNLDVTLEKRIPLGKSERRVVRMRLEAYNLLNHTEFSAMGTTLQLLNGNNTNTQYGQYTATQPARVLSTTVRIEF
jgi:hypothetical protein